MKRNIKLTIEYDGTDFEGWQIQKKGHRTVQGEIEKALRQIFKKSTRLIGAGRTDSGVHAFGQVAHFKVHSKMELAEIQRALNANLPGDIVVRQIAAVPLNFHAQYKVKTKTYRYTILNRWEPSAQLRNFCWHVPRPVNVALLRREAKELIGRKNFRSFMAADPAFTQDKNTVRTVQSLTIRKKADFIYIDITGDGFLYKMVRTITGTLVQIGQGRLPPGSIKNILRKKDRRFAGYTAKPQGLCLLEIKY